MHKLSAVLLSLMLLAVSALPSYAQHNCPTPLQLQVGATGVVMPGSPNRVRETASTSASIITEMPSGAEFSVVGGPNCADGIVWWLVDFNDVRGWTAESVGESVFLQPASGAVRVPSVPEIPADAVSVPSVVFDKGAEHVKISGGEVLLVASTGDKDIVDLWDIDTGTYYQMAFGSNASIIYFMENAAEDRYITGNSGGVINFWDVMFAADGSPIQTPLVSSADFPPHYATNGDFTSVAAAGCYRATGNDCEMGMAIFYDLNTRETRFSLEHSSYVTALAYHQSVPLVATANAEGYLYIWDTVDGSLTRTLYLGETDITALAFSPVSHLLAVGWCVAYDDDGCLVGAVSLVDSDTGALVATYPTHTGTVSTLEFNAEGTQIASGGIDGVVRVRELLGGTLTQTFTPTDFGSITDVAFFVNFAELVIAGERGLGVFSLE